MLANLPQMPKGLWWVWGGLWSLMTKGCPSGWRITKHQYVTCWSQDFWNQSTQSCHCIPETHLMPWLAVFTFDDNAFRLSSQPWVTINNSIWLLFTDLLNYFPVVTVYCSSWFLEPMVKKPFKEGFVLNKKQTENGSIIHLVYPEAQRSMITKMTTI